MNQELCSCGSEISRRRFIKSSLAGAALAAAAPVWLPRTRATINGESETLVATLFKSLSDEQRRAVCFPFDHPLRSEVDNNWFITDKKLAQFYTKDQQAMVREIFLKLHSPEYADRVLKQVEHDAGNAGFGNCAIALFGEPGTGQFEFVLTGRHCTRRCDGDSVAGAAFGGPIFYGHAAHGFYEKPDHPDNIYWYQARRANDVFQMLDGRQRHAALLATAREEQKTATVKLSGKSSDLAGLPVSDLSADQKEHVRQVMADLLAPFRKADADEVMSLIDKNGFDQLHLSFYKNQDVGGDGIWDVWQIEGPAMLWYFRGDPHVHTWVHVRDHA